MWWLRSWVRGDAHLSKPQWILGCPGFISIASWKWCNFVVEAMTSCILVAMLWSAHVSGCVSLDISRPFCIVLDHPRVCRIALTEGGCIMFVLLRAVLALLRTTQRFHLSIWLF